VGCAGCVLCAVFAWANRLIDPVATLCCCCCGVELFRLLHSFFGRVILKREGKMDGTQEDDVEEKVLNEGELK
jgi:hypothetical protein